MPLAFGTRPMQAHLLGPQIQSMFQGQKRAVPNPFGQPPGRGGHRSGYGQPLPPSHRRPKAIIGRPWGPPISPVKRLTRAHAFVAPPPGLARLKGFNPPPTNPGISYQGGTSMTKMLPMQPMALSQQPIAPTVSPLQIGVSRQDAVVVGGAIPTVPAPHGVSPQDAMAVAGSGTPYMREFETGAGPVVNGNGTAAPAETPNWQKYALAGGLLAIGLAVVRGL